MLVWVYTGEYVLVTGKACDHAFDHAVVTQTQARKTMVPPGAR